MEFPSWFQSAVRQRVDTFISHLERYPAIQQVQMEEQHAFDAVWLGMEERQKVGFLEWEGRQSLLLAVKQEELYLQGVRDGAQLVYALLKCRCMPDDGSAEDN